jgi:hypothetical protein
VAQAEQELLHLTQDHHLLMLVAEAEVLALLKHYLILLRLAVLEAAVLVVVLVVLELLVLQILVAVAVLVLAVLVLLLEQQVVQVL